MSQAAACWSNLRNSKVRRASMSGAPARPRHIAHAPVPVVETVATESQNANFDSLMKHCNQRVYRLALRITRNHQDAEDARQETFLKAYRHLDQFEGRSRFTTWISRIAINEGLMNLRKRNDSRRVPLDEIAETAIEGDALVKLRRPIEDPEVSFTRRQLRGGAQWSDCCAAAALSRCFRTADRRGAFDFGDCEDARAYCEHREDAVAPGTHRASCLSAILRADGAERGSAGGRRKFGSGVAVRVVVGRLDL